jgi:hypothetical protein
MQTASRTLSRLLLIFTGVLLLSMAASATESGATVWPVGAESIAMAAAVPHTGQTTVYEYTCFYEANELDDAHGKKLNGSPYGPPDFKLRVFATAVKFSHNWGVKFLGGEIGSWIAVPNVYQQLHLPGEKYSKDALTNINIVPFTVYNHKGMVHWYYELQFETTGSGYEKGAELNIGQHNVALTPAFAITLTPHHGEQEVSSRFDYIINNVDHATHYHSGNEFVWQFDARQEIPHHKASIGLVGYYYQQVTNDHQSGAAVVTTNADGTQSIGYKGRVLDLGPQVTLPFGKHGGMAFKWDHDMLVQNKTRGNAFWFQFGIPFSYLHHPAAK